jgi:AGZA family xanthine/uracil permease-like MFS transporter
MAFDGRLWLRDHFALEKRGTSVRTEFQAGCTTYLAMVYIVVVNPTILSNAGMDRGAVFVATCLVAAIASALMGFFANLPIALAPAMGLNAYFAFTAVKTYGMPWQVALGAVFIAGAAFFLIALVGWGEKLFTGIPDSLKRGIVVGIGLFLALIGLNQMGVVVRGESLLQLGDLTAPPTLLACLGFLVMTALAARKFSGAILVGIAVTWVLGIAFKAAPMPPSIPISLPPSILPVFGQLDIKGAWSAANSLSVILSFFLVAVLDNASSLHAVSVQTGLKEKDHTPGEYAAEVVDSGAAVLSSVLGTSTALSFLESLTGVHAGGRTGLTAMFTALLFALTLIFAPLATDIPVFATAPALLLASCQMMRGMHDQSWDDYDEFLPAVVVAVTIPFTLSIVTGVGLGFVVHLIMKLAMGKRNEVQPAVWIIVVLWILVVVLPASHQF